MNQERPFLDREEELKALGDLWAEDQAQLVIVYGRRRVGKTELLTQFCRHKRACYFLATQTKDAENLRAFVRVLRLRMTHPVLADGVVPTWEALLEALAGEAMSKPLGVVLDEFQYLCRDRKDLPSLLQKFWDTRGRKTKLFLVLCGSQISFMEEKILGERSPLFGRRTAQFLLRPFSYREASLFHPRGTSEEKVGLYAVFGGLPAYLCRWRPKKTLRENVISTVLRPGAPLYDEVTFLLRTELGEPHTYSAILSALAAGKRRLRDIAEFVGIPAVSAGQYLQTLQDLRLVERLTPMAEKGPGPGRKGRYFLADPFLRFWHRFVQPNRSLIEVGRAELVFDTLIRPELPAYTGQVFESVCRQFLQRAPDAQWTPCRRVGTHWGKDLEVDIVTENIDGSHYICECKWTGRPVPIKVLEELRTKCDRLPDQLQRECRLVIFSRRGFTAALEARADAEGVRLVGLPEIF
jgi:AAA+ ATPase superfamily predicted ATPase